METISRISLFTICSLFTFLNCKQTFAADIALSAGCEVRKSYPADSNLQARVKLNPHLNTKITVIRDRGGLEGDSIIRPGWFVTVTGNSLPVFHLPGLLLIDMHSIKCTDTASPEIFRVGDLVYELLATPNQAKEFHKLEYHDEAKFRLGFSDPEYCTGCKYE